MAIYLARVERHVDTTRVEAFSRRIRLAASRPLHATDDDPRRRVAAFRAA
ncbi:hypothetical protein [Sphingomonas aquatilis]|nr:hypothetical protein [Sphingomonas aquatilis]MCI4654524.1 hypothetical protein [Sphingomonas aquatilis]